MELRAVIDQLLYEEEGDTLDFKSEQYPFSGATDEEKSELLKDILAFANAWRRADAYILIGAKEVKGGRSEIVGLSEHIDDARLQQFVNSKTQRPITFSYKALAYDGHQIGVIHIPVQRRPFYLNKDFGRLKQDTVYIRRSSSTAIASIDEISLMGNAIVEAQNHSASLDAFLVSGVHNEVVVKRVTAKLTNAIVPTNLPDYGISNLRNMPVSLSIDLANRDYYREKAKYIRDISRMRGFGIGIRNSGTIPAKDVKVVFEIQKSSSLKIVHESRVPEKPQQDNFSKALPSFMGKESPDIFIKEMPQAWKITCHLGKIQPKDFKVTKNYFFISAGESGILEMKGEIFSDDLPEPQNVILEVGIEMEDRQFTVDDLLEKS